MATTSVFLPEEFRGRKEPGKMQSTGTQSTQDWAHVHVITGSGGKEKILDSGVSDKPPRSDFRRVSRAGADWQASVPLGPQGHSHLP